MKKLFLLALIVTSTAAFAQTNVRVRGTITALEGDVLSVKSRDGRDLKIGLAPDAAVATAKAATLADLKGAYVGTTAMNKGGRLVAVEVHVLPPTAASGHTPWDLEPGSTMTNANLSTVAKVTGGDEITLQYKDGSQKILVPPGTPIIAFDNGDRSALKPGETIWTDRKSVV